MDWESLSLRSFGHDLYSTVVLYWIVSILEQKDEQNDSELIKSHFTLQAGANASWLPCYVVSISSFMVGVWISSAES